MILIMRSLVSVLAKHARNPDEKGALFGVKFASSQKNVELWTEFATDHPWYRSEENKQKNNNKDFYGFKWPPFRPDTHKVDVTLIQVGRRAVLPGTVPFLQAVSR